VLDGVTTPLRTEANRRFAETPVVGIKIT
jgi:hypothetical protein